MNRTNRRKPTSKPASRWQRVRLMLETLERRDLLALSVLTTADPSWWGTTGNAPSGGPSISGDGTLIAFESYAGNLAVNSVLAPTGGLGQARQVFVRDAITGQTNLISFDPAGNPLDASRPVISNDGHLSPLLPAMANSMFVISIPIPLASLPRLQAGSSPPVGPLRLPLCRRTGATSPSTATIPTYSLLTLTMMAMVM
ncbi:MAG: hypothetical protein QM703_14800 [Gemmatales bacterium]